MTIKKVVLLQALTGLLAVMTVNAQVPIRTNEDMRAISRDKKSKKSSYILMNDLVLEDWTPLEFNGRFDGNGHTITIAVDMRETAGKVRAASVAYSAGLFSMIGNRGLVTNLHVAGNISCEANYFMNCLGGITGYNAGSIEACVSSVDINGKGIGQASERIKVEVSVGGGRSGYEGSAYPYDGGTLAGGIAGINKGRMVNCYSTGDIEVSGDGLKIAGGIAAGNGNDLITGPMNSSVIVVSNCYATGGINVYGDGKSRIAGGIVGRNIVSVANCVALNNRVEVSGKSSVDGNKDKSNVTSAGHVSGENYSMGRFNNKGVVKECFYSEGMVIELEQDPAYKPNEEDGGSEMVPLTETKGQNWWVNRAGFKFGQAEPAPWVWDETLQRPVLYWEQRR